MKRIALHLKIYQRFLRIALMLLIEWRASFLIWTIVHAAELTINIAFFGIVLTRTPSVGGWGIYEIVILLGYMELILGLGGMTFYPMMYDFGENITNGNLDFKLVKPVDIQFLVSFPWPDVSDIFSILSGLFVITVGLINLRPAHPLANILLFIPLLISSMVILYSIVIMLLTLTFRSTKLDRVANLYWTFAWMGKYPVSVFKGSLHFILMFILPIGIVASVPARVLAGVWELPAIAFSFVLAILLFSLSRRIFLANIRNYSSASS